MIESALGVGFRSSCLSYSVSVASCGLSWNPSACDDCPIVSRSRAINRRGISDLNTLWSRSKFQRRCSFTTRNHYDRCSGCNVPTARVHVGPDYSDSDCKEAPYHPFEEIRESVLQENDAQEPAKLTDAEMSRTIVEVNSKAMLLFSGMSNDEGQPTIFWPELSFVTDEHGDIYFEVHNDEDVLQTLTSDDNSVQVIIGVNSMDMLSDMELFMPAHVDIDIKEVTDEEGYSSNDDDNDDKSDEEDYEEDWLSILDNSDDESDTSETLGDWANLETMRSSHPMFFASRMSEVVSNLDLDWMDQPSNAVAIQGLLRPAFIEEQSIVREHKKGNKLRSDYRSQVELESDHGMSPKDSAIWRQGLDNDENQEIGSSFYKLEIVNIELVSAYGSQTTVKIEDFRKAQPDTIAHSAAKIISDLRAGGEKTLQALKSLCWRCKGINVQEASIVGVDSLGFDMRVCSGTQIQTLRFAFKGRATSQFCAEKQVREMLFPEG